MRPFGNRLALDEVRMRDDSEYEYPHVARQMNPLEAVGSVLDEDGKGGYRFDRMTFKNPIDILGFAPSVHERPAHLRK
jgi:hypothetical protein